MTPHPLPVARVPGDTPPIRVALVGCGDQKLPRPAPAHLLYTGALFMSARRYTEAALADGMYDTWYILSARHGLVSPTRILDPYDAEMPADVDGIRTWVNRVDVAFRSIDPGYGKWTGRGGRLTVDILAGAAYADPLLAAWRGISWEIRTPLAGLQMGQRRGWFRDHTPAAAA